MAVSRETLEAVTHKASFAADTVALELRGRVTDATLTDKIIERALECLIGNNVIEILPQDQWDMWFKVDPPYDVNRIQPKE